MSHGLVENEKMIFFIKALRLYACHNYEVSIADIFPEKCFTGDNTVGSDMDALICIQQIPVLKAKVQEKPWLRPGQ